MEYSYVVKSPFVTNLHPWQFQDRYPCRWSEYQAAVPDLFNYLYLEKGGPLSYFIKASAFGDSTLGRLRMGISMLISN